jgi:hypothetical protein
VFKKMLAALAATIVGLGLVSAPASASVPDWDKKPAVSPHSTQVAKDFPFLVSHQRKTALTPPSSMVVRAYTGARQGIVSTGFTAGMKVRDNYWDTYDYHNLTEISVQDNSDNIVELIWGHGSWCPSSATCLASFYWVNGVGASNYNVGFVDYAGSNLNMGDTLTGTTETTGCTLPASKNERFSIAKNTTTGAWMLWADLCYGDSTAGQWLGEFPASLWTSSGASFTQSDFVQIFNETATQYNAGGSPNNDGYPCSDQGASLATSVSGTGMRFADMTLTGVANTSVNFVPYVDSTGGYINSEMTTPAPGKYGAAILAGQPAGNARYINAGGLAFGPTGNTVGGANCT